jgi:pimeloyl-ACP methyl ester carboxylesterase
LNAGLPARNGHRQAADRAPAAGGLHAGRRGGPTGRSPGPAVKSRAEPCATWPTRDQDRYTGPFTRRTSAPILVVGTRFDPASPYQNALTVTRELPRSRLLTLDGWGHVAFGKRGCIADHVDRYLVTVALPPPGTTCRPDQRPFG